MIRWICCVIRFCWMLIFFVLVCLIGLVNCGWLLDVMVVIRGWCWFICCWWFGMCNWRLVSILFLICLRDIFVLWWFCVVFLWLVMRLFVKFRLFCLIVMICGWNWKLIMMCSCWFLVVSCWMSWLLVMVFLWWVVVRKLIRLSRILRMGVLFVFIEVCCFYDMVCVGSVGLVGFCLKFMDDYFVRGNGNECFC